MRFVGDSPGPVRAKVLIGADGYFSAVREQCLGDGPPDFAVRPSCHGPRCCPFTICPASIVKREKSSVSMSCY